MGTEAATGARTALTARHVGNGRAKLGRTGDRELQSQRRAVDFRLPHSGESRGCQQQQRRRRCAGLQRGHRLRDPGEKRSEHRHQPALTPPARSGSAPPHHQTLSSPPATMGKRQKQREEREVCELSTAVLMTQ
ncbi:hypothetical protein OJAV_G00108470 [Oryzias javanicus]|uniref:Uncharacterized protein n=1 Tax=Oryzias javanicus TaxID=123683 RepID=A0A3S2P4N5_ORYJA|nr:hypothetical protein OJAV_G00108470 [Oryzias javanicus]